MKSSHHRFARPRNLIPNLERFVQLLTKFLALICWLPITTSGIESPKTAKSSPPNIIIVMTDDQGYGDLGCTGNPIVRTPNIDRFYTQSVRFTDFHVSPTCAPTRSALMSGRHEFKNGVTHTIHERERLALDTITLAQVLRRNRYRTGIFGKWHLGDQPEYLPNRRGFDEVFIHGAGGIGQSYAGSCGDAPGNSYFDPWILHNGKFVKTQGYCTDVFFSQAIQWIDEQRNRRRPFFLMITPNAPHAPLHCPETYLQRYRSLTISTNAAKFYGMIENIDDNFGRLTERLEAWGLADNTLVIFMTDNGGTVGVNIFNGGRRGGKATAYQGATRVPSFWRWPRGFEGGSDRPQLAAHIDVFPTILDILEVAPSHTVKTQVEGRSLWPLLKNSTIDWPDRTLVTHVGRWEKGKIAENKYRNASIRNRRFSLVNNTELYDLVNDPEQKVNVASANPETTDLLQSQYESWWESVQKRLVNENAHVPEENSFKTYFRRQFGGKHLPAAERMQ